MKFPAPKPLRKIAACAAALAAFTPAVFAQYFNPRPFDVLLGRPTDRSIAVSLLSTDSREVIIDYGTQSGAYANQSTLTALPAGAPTVVTLAGLQSDTPYSYRVRNRPTGTTTFANAPEGSFVTQRAVGKTFTFDIEADPHYQHNEPPAWTTTLADILADKPDFLIDLGDTFRDEKTNTLALADITKSRQVVRATAAAQLGAFAIPAGSRDAALLSSLSPGAYTAQVSGKNAAAGTALLEAYDSSSSATSARFINVAARTQVGMGGAVLIAGFVVQGTAPKQLLIPGVGPTLAAFGVPNALSDPQLALFQQGVAAPIQQNDNWGSAANTAQIAGAAMLVMLPPGAYGAQVSGVGNRTGVDMVEI